MIAFGDPGQAVLCSIEVQRALHEKLDRWGAIRVRIDIQLCNPREVDLKGLVGSHKVYPVKLPI